MRFTAFLVAHIVCCKCVFYYLLPAMIILIILRVVLWCTVSVAAWMIYSLVLWILLSIGLGFYYAFNDFRHFAVHFWSWFM